MPGSEPKGRTSPPGEPAARTVLCVDDNETKRYLRGHALRSAGFDVIEAADGASTLRLALEALPAAIVLDIRLPDLNGFEVCDRLRRDARTAAIPILHVSAVGQPEFDLPEALEHESDAYLREPIDPHTLAATVQALIRTREYRDKLHRSEARFRGMLENALEGVWVVDHEARTEFVNQRMVEMLGYDSPDELAGRSAFDFLPADLRGGGVAAFQARLSSDSRQRYETPLVRRDGSVIWTSVAGNTLFDEHGHASGRMALFTDMTQQKLAHTELVESRKRLELALEAAELGTWEADMATGMITASQRTCAMFDTADPAGLAEIWVSRLDPEDRERVAEELRVAFGSASRYESEHRVLRPDGTKRWLHVKGAPAADGTGRPSRMVGVVQDITRQKEEEQARERERELLQGIVENIPVMLCLYDPTLQRFELNREAQRVLGWTNAEANEGDFLAKCYPDPEQRARVAEYMRRLTPGWLELDTRTKDGSEVRTEWANLGLSGGRSLGIGIDVSERKRAEEQIRTTLESIGDGFFACDSEWRFVYFNAAAEREVGMPREEVIGRTFWELFPPTVGTRFASELRRGAEGEQREFENFYEPWGRWFHNRVFPRAGGGVSVYFRDVTERKRAQQEVEDYRAKLDAAMASMTDAVFITDAEGRFVEFNDAFATFHRFRSKAECGKTLAEYPDILEFFLPDGKPAPVEMWAGPRALRGETITNAEYGLRRKDTGESWVGSYSFGPIRGRDGGIVGSVVIARDITELKRAEEALRRSEARERARAAEMEAILEAAPVAIFVGQDPECRNIIGSAMLYEMLGMPQGSNVSKSPPEGDPLPAYRVLREGRELPPAELPAQKAAATGKAVRNYEFDVALPDGAVRKMIGDAVPLFDDDGRPRGAVGAFLDITELKQNEERLRHAQKLESVGLLAGGIAHDFNNLLVGILGNASMVLEDIPPETAAPVKEIVACAERAAHLTRQLLAYAGKGQFVAKSIDVSEAVREISDLVDFSIPKSAQLSVTVEARLPALRMDPGQLQQILMNLVINAGEAIGEGNPGKISVSTSMRDVEEEIADATGAKVAPGRYVTIEISDTGCGMTEETRRRIFEPFFSTKFTGRGLGLAAVAGIVRSQRGGIFVEPKPGAGTTFRVLLPAADRRTPELEAGGPAATTILVVDDEHSVRNLVAAALRRRGYRVLTASDGREALAVCDREKERIDVVVLDIVMPIMGANDLLPVLMERRPGMRVLLTSGYTETEARRLCAAYPRSAFLQKPFTAQQLAKAIERLK